MDNSNLSIHGQQRREEILRMALRTAWLRKRRRLAHIAAVGALTILAALFVKPSSPGVDPVRIALLKPPPQKAEPQIVFIQTDATISRRLSVVAEPPRWQRIGDEDLLGELAYSGQPAGLIHMNGQTFLLPR